MSREAKIIDTSVLGVEKTINHYESFGWELLSLNGEKIVMSRETQIPVYADLVKNEIKYAELLKEYVEMKYPEKPLPPPPFGIGKFIILFILGIIPGLCYLCYKAKQRSNATVESYRYYTQIERCDKRKEDILKEIDQLVMDSRATFFGKYKV